MLNSNLMLRRGVAAIVAPLLLVAAAAHENFAAAADSGKFDAAGFFRGKTVEVVVNSTPGSGLDNITRLIMSRLSDTVPGNPRFQASNLDDVAGMSAVYDAPPGRLVIGSTIRASNIYSSMLDASARHDIYKMRFIGGQGAEPSVSVIFNEPAKAFNGFRDASGKKTPVLKYVETVGDETAVIGGAYAASWMCDTFNLTCSMKNVAKAGTTALIPAIERGEVDWIESNAANTARLFAEKFKTGRAKVFAEHSTNKFTAKITTPYPRPHIEELLPASAKAEYERIVPLIGSGGIGLTFFAGPNFPVEAAKALGEGLVKLLNEPEFMKRVAQTRVGSDLPGVTYTAVAIGPEDAQKIVLEQAKIFFANKDFYRKKQKEYYEKYWK